MVLKVKILMFIAVFSIGISVNAQTNSNYQDKKWGVETELIQPFLPTIEIFQFQLTRTIFNFESGQKGDLVLGAYLRPNVKHEVVEEISEYMLFIGYRHFFWKGFHAEGGMNTGYYWGHKNLVDGKDYEGVGMYYEANIGYKLDFGKNKMFYFMLQAGIIGTMGLSDIGPRNGETDHFPQGALYIGVNF